MAVAVAVIALVTTCGSEDVDRPATSVDARRDDATTRVPPTARPRHPATAAPDSAASAADTTTAPAAQPDDGGFPAIDVVVVRADGSTAPGFVVYALPAGAPGRADLNTVTHAATGADGHCRLLLPKFGSFDIGAQSLLEFAMQTDVSVPRKESLVLTLSAVSELEFVADEGALERLTKANGLRDIVFVQSQANGGGWSAIGRGEPHAWGFAVGFTPESATVRVMVPAGEVARTWSNPGLRVWPTKVRPPARVDVSLSGLLPATLLVRPTPPEILAKLDGWLAIEIDPGDGRAAGTCTVHFRHGQIDEGVGTPAYVEWFSPEGGVARWHGRGVVPGECRIPAATRARPAAVELNVVLDGAPLPRDPPADSGVRELRTAKFEIRPTGLGPSRDSARCSVDSDAGGRCSADVADDGMAHIDCNVPAWVGAVHGSRAARLVRVNDEPTAPIELGLEPGGFLLIDCPTKPPAKLGRIAIARKDGLPLPYKVGDLLESIDAITGDTIGPLPAGDYALVLRLSGIDVGEITATVRADETQTLRIPKLPMR